MTCGQQDTWDSCSIKKSKYGHYCKNDSSVIGMLICGCIDVEERCPGDAVETQLVRGTPGPVSLQMTEGPGGAACRVIACRNTAFRHITHSCELMKSPCIAAMLSFLSSPLEATCTCRALISGIYYHPKAELESRYAGWPELQQIKTALSKSFLIHQQIIEKALLSYW